LLRAAMRAASWAADSARRTLWVSSAEAPDKPGVHRRVLGPSLCRHSPLARA
jgi:hypothetical protein